MIRSAKQEGWKRRCCFACHKLTDDVFVFWHGDDGTGHEINIVFHPVCAANLAIHLGADALQGDVKNGYHLGYPPGGNRITDDDCRRIVEAVFGFDDA